MFGGHKAQSTTFSVFSYECDRIGMVHVTADASQPSRHDPFSVPTEDDQLKDVSVIVKERSLLNSDPLVISSSIRQVLNEKSLRFSLISTCKVTELVLAQHNPISHDGGRKDDRHEVLPTDSLQIDYISAVAPTPLSITARSSLAGAFLLTGQKISALHR